MSIKNNDKELMLRCGYCGKKFARYKPYMIHHSVKIDENPKQDGYRTQPVCSECSTEIISDMAKYKPGKLYIE